MAEKETKLVNEEIILDESVDIDKDSEEEVKATVTIELDEEVDLGDTEIPVDDIGFINEEELNKAFDEMSKEEEDEEITPSIQEPDEDMTDEELKEIIKDIQDLVDSMDEAEEEFEDNLLDDAVSHEDIVSATDELVTEIANDLRNDSEMKEYLFDDIGDEDESDLPDWESDDEDWVDELEEGDDWESDDIASPFGEKLVSGLGRFGRLRRSSYLNNKEDEESLDDSYDDDNLFDGSSFDTSVFGGPSILGRTRPDFATFGVSNGPFTSNNDYNNDEPKLGLENMKSHIEDKIECVGKKIINNKSLIASGVIGTVAVIGGIVAYKLFKNKSK